MKTYSRRDLMKLAGAFGIGSGLPVLVGCAGNQSVVMTDGTTARAYDLDTFAHGVASGDPLSDRVIIWTRASTEQSQLTVAWEIATSPEFEVLAAAGNAIADREHDHTVKIDVTGLNPGTTYYYRFLGPNGTSPIGRTKTTASGPLDRARMAVVSCANYPAGFFNVYARIAERADLDVVLHLGDYIYESASAGDLGRAHLPAQEILSLEDYRSRYAQYRSDPDLQALHQQHPMICVWDDHESTNNSWSDGAANHTEGDEGAWVDRKAISVKVYREWMPIRDPDIGPESERIYRDFRFGDLAHLIMLDTRLIGRNEQLSGMSERRLAWDEELNDPSRTILGEEQEAWLTDALRQTDQKWRFLGQQVFFGQRKTQPAPNALGGGLASSADAWDGYNGARKRILDQLSTEAINNVCVLTGDVHKAYALDISDDPNNPAAYTPASGEGALATEFVCTSVTSGGDRNNDQPEQDQFDMTFVNPHIKYIERSKHGYILLDITHTQTLAEYWSVGTVHSRDTTHQFELAFPVYAGDNHLSSAISTASTPDGAAATLAPLATRDA